MVDSEAMLDMLLVGAPVAEVVGLSLAEKRLFLNAFVIDEVGDLRWPDPDVDVTSSGELCRLVLLFLHLDLSSPACSSDVLEPNSEL